MSDTKADAGLVRITLYAKGLDTASLIAAANAISAARDSLDQVGNDDQGITGATAGTSNIVPLDSNVSPSDALTRICSTSCT